MKHGARRPSRAGYLPPQVSSLRHQRLPLVLLRGTGRGRRTGARARGVSGTGGWVGFLCSRDAFFWGVVLGMRAISGSEAVCSRDIPQIGSRVEVTRKRVAAGSTRRLRSAGGTPRRSRLADSEHVGWSASARISERDILSGRAHAASVPPSWEGGARNAIASPVAPLRLGLWSSQGPPRSWPIEPRSPRGACWLPPASVTRGRRARRAVVAWRRGRPGPRAE